MATAMQTATTQSSISNLQDAIELLRADHTKMIGLFYEFERARTVASKKTLVAQICLELTVHASIEEEIFYPAVKAALKDHEIIPEANIEHAAIKMLIDQVTDIEPNGAIYDARIKVMSEFVKHHIQEEQMKMFPKAKKTQLDMFALGAMMADRKAELLTELSPQAPSKERPNLLRKSLLAMGAKLATRYTVKNGPFSAND